MGRQHRHLLGSPHLNISAQDCVGDLTSPTGAWQAFLSSWRNGTSSNSSSWVPGGIGKECRVLRQDSDSHFQSFSCQVRIPPKCTCWIKLSGILWPRRPSLVLQLMTSHGVWRKSGCIYTWVVAFSTLHASYRFPRILWETSNKFPGHPCATQGDFIVHAVRTVLTIPLSYWNGTVLSSVINS